MDNDLDFIGTLIRDALVSIRPPKGRRRPSTKAIYEALKSLTAMRSALSTKFGGPVKCRYAGCPPVIKRNGTRKVLGYLWDFSFSRFGIPDAIEQGGKSLGGHKYEILFVAESELGTNDEICRDLLKLLDARAAIRCLIYRQPRHSKRRSSLHSRMIRVLNNHSYFDPRAEQWLFIGLAWRAGSIAANAYTLAPDGLQLVPSPCAKVKPLRVQENTE